MITASAISAFQSIETPFYYYDMELLDKTLDIYTQQIKKYGYHAHFALKAKHFSNMGTFSFQTRKARSFLLSPIGCTAMANALGRVARATYIAYILHY